MTEKEEKKAKLRLGSLRDVLEKDVQEQDIPPASKEKVELKGPQPKELQPKENEPQAPKEKLWLSAINYIIHEQSDSTDDGEDNNDKKERIPSQKQVANELNEELKESLNLHKEAVKLAQEVFEKVRQGQMFEMEGVRKVVEKITDGLTLGNQGLVQLAISPDEGYSQLASNAVNVAIVSIKIGLSLNYNKSSLVELGMISFFRDIGLILLRDIIEQPRRLEHGEYEEIKKHPLYTEKFLEDFGIRNEIFKQVVLQHHERHDGSGYPNKLKGESIHEYAKIIAVAEVYESLTHNRPVRAGMPPHTAMREMLEEGKSLFGHRVIKAFVKVFGVYPVCSTVELNTGEIAKVIAVHKDFPLRPIIQVILDSARKPANKILNLLEKPQVFIKKPVDDVTFGE